MSLSYLEDNEGIIPYRVRVPDCMSLSMIVERLPSAILDAFIRSFTIQH